MRDLANDESDKIHSDMDPSDETDSHHEVHPEVGQEPLDYWLGG